MNYSFSTLLVVFAAVCAVLVVAKFLKVEKVAAVLGVGVVVVWAILHFTGYDETIYRVIFNPPPLEHQSPFNR
jgi:Na+/H+ antiporter NhaA